MESCIVRNNVSTHFNNVTDTKIVYFKKVRASLKVTKDKISRPYDGEKIEITKGEYGEIEKLFNEINRKVDLDNFTYSIDPLPNIFQFGCIIGKALPLRAHKFLVFWVSKV